MKKFFSLALMLVLALSLVACGGSSSDDIKEPSAVSTGVAESEEPAESVEPEEPAETEETEVLEEPSVTIEDTVLLDEAGVKITAKGLSTDELFGAELKLLIENNSGKDLTVQSRNASVNGYMIGTMLSADIVDGKKANDTLTLMESDLEDAGITEIADIEFSFHIFTTDDWETFLDSPQIQIKTSIADTHEYVFDDSGEIAYDGNGVKVVVKGLAEDTSIFGPSIVVFVENNSDNTITVQTRDVSVNGFMVDAMFSCDVTSGKKAVDTITFLDSTLEENGITSIDDVELSFHIFDTDSWDTIVDSEVVNITFATQ